MNLKVFGLSTLAAAVSITASTVAAAPAQALALSFDFAGPPNSVAPSFQFTNGSLSVIATPQAGNVVRNSLGLGVRNANTDNTDQIDGFTTIPAPQFTDRLTLTFNQSVKILSATFRSVGLTDDFRLFLDGSSVLDADIPGGNLFDSDTGTFSFSPSIAYSSVLGFGVTGSNDDYYLSGITVQPIPTPALLPGLVGMGIAALSKRKGEATKESSEA